MPLSASGGLLAALALGDYARWRSAEGARLEQGSRIVSTARGDVELVEEGEDGDGLPILMVHGSPGGYDFGRMMGHLLGLTDCHVIAPSRPGYLRTPVSSGRTPEEQADLLAALLDVLGIDRAAVLGASGGGPCALSFAQRHADRCSHLVLIESVTAAYSERAMYAALPAIARPGKWLSTAAGKTNVTGYLTAQLGRLEKSGMLAELAHSIARYDLRKRGYEMDLEQFTQLGVMPVDRVTMPTLIVHGSKDTDVPPRQSEDLASRIPSSRLVIEDGLNHVSLWSSPRIGSEVRSVLEVDVRPAD